MYLSARAQRELQRRLTDDSVITLNVISLAVLQNKRKYIYKWGGNWMAI